MFHPNHLEAREVLGWWTWDPWVAVFVLLACALYARGVRRLWSAAGRGHGVRPWQVASFGGGIFAILVALFSPLDKLSDVLFSAHMSQHELLLLVAPPLVVFGRSLFVMLWGLPDRARDRVSAWAGRPRVRAAWRAITAPLVVVVVHGLALWIWHAPRLFEAALADENVHRLQHLSFFVTAALFWWTLLHGRYGRAAYGVSVLYVFATAMHSGLLGALLTVARHVAYPAYEGPARAWGIDALEDQQRAGLLMWIPAGIVLAVLGLAMFAAWLGEAERRATRNGGVS